MCLVNTEDKSDITEFVELLCVHMFVNYKLFNVIERRLLCSSRLHLFDQKYSKNSNMQYCEILLQFKTTVLFFILKYNLIL